MKKLLLNSNHPSFNSTQDATPRVETIFALRKPTMRVRRCELQISEETLKIQLKKRHVAKRWIIGGDEEGTNKFDTRKLIHAMKNSKDLKELRLDLPAWKDVTVRKLGYLNERMKKLSSLETIDIEFFMPQHLTKEGFQFLNKGLQQQRLLKKLDININW